MPRPPNSLELIIPPRFILRTLADVAAATARLDGDDRRLPRNATAMSAAEWLVDMAWLDKHAAAGSLPTSQTSFLRELFRARHRQVWGAYAHTPD
jgi:hypothetical protein